MTTIDQPQETAEPDELVAAAPATLWDRFESLLIRAGDHLNPILVKEARQALRSKQFVVTFMLMLAAGWIWSIVGLASIGPAVYYSAAGPQMLFVYHLILSFPLLIVAPYSAFHSLSSERQDRTYELLSITSLGARQILSGKMCGIGLQMMVYLSAIFPCLAFTYLLRGLDIFTIVLVVVYTCLLSLALSATGLLLAAVSPLRQRHIGLSVIFTLVLFGAMSADNTWTSALIYFTGLSPSASQFWEAQLLIVTLFLNYFAIVFLAARSQLLTASENRSTALRWALIAAQLSFVAWMAYLQMAVGGDYVPFVLIYFSAVGWFVAGTFLTGESGVLTPRVKRDLPQTTVARWLLTWFTPGPGTGYMFVLANMVTVSMLALLPYDWIADQFRGAAGAGIVGGSVPAAAVAGRAVFVPRTSADPWDVLGAAVIATSYLAIYLGLGALIVRGIRRFTAVRLALPVAVNVCLLLIGCLTPWVIQMTSVEMRRLGWTLLQIPNAAWTLGEVCFRNPPIEMPVLALTLATLAMAVWLLNLPALSVALEQVRIAKPPRVEQEDAARAAALAGAIGPKNPWDEDH